MNGKYFKIDRKRNKFYMASTKYRDEQWRKEADHFWDNMPPIEKLPFAEFTLDLEFCNTKMAKLLLDFLTILETIPSAKVIWLYDNEDVLEFGEEFNDLIDGNVQWEFRRK